MTDRPGRDPLSDLPWPAPSEPGERVSAAIRSHCTKDLCAERSLSCSSRALISLGLSLALLLWLTYWAAGRPAQREMIEAGLLGAAGWGVVQAGVLLFYLARPPGRRGPAPRRVAVLFAVPVLFLGYLVLTATETVSLAEFSSGAHAAHALRCSLLTLLFGGLVAAGGLLVWRRTDPIQPGLSGALLGLVGGLGGALAMNVACASHETHHLWFSHGLAVIALTLLGWGAGRRLLAP
jgi:hypothetical protein